MIILIPLGGIGERFSSLGYKKPKPLINVLGKQIIFWLLDNLKFDNIDLIIIPYNYELSKYRFEDTVQKRYPDYKFFFIKLESNTNGAAETILYGLNKLDIPDCPVLCMDGDNFYTCDIINQWNGDNSIFYFIDESDSHAYSFLEIENDNVINIVEKNRISKYASTGAYGFSSYQTLKKYCNIVISNNIKQLNEYYTSGIISQMIVDGHSFIGKNVSINDYVCLGTPFDIRLFCNNYPRINASTNKIQIKSQRYCFDLDNTLVTYPKKAGDYSTVEPITNTINYLKYLKKIGHTIIIYTARRMNTHHGNIGRVVADVGQVTLETLRKFDIPFDEIYFGKPFADYYIDDMAISPFDDIEKELGYYQTLIDTRSFNSITNDVIHIYNKYGIDLSGEIYWYNHIPLSIKDMFPVFIKSGDNYYSMEKINGIPFSKLLIAGDLSIKHLDNIINSILRIHHCPIPSNEPEINIYQNYLPKLEARYAQYDYSEFQNHQTVYQTIYNKLIQYQDGNLGHKSVIHGDPVLTNIMLNQYGKIKFIDMRGKINSTLTILGDQLYDWGKLYQSLIGYDEILENKIVSLNYKQSLINHFEHRFTEIYGEEKLVYLKYITASLLFTLIPLHHNQKCIQYYNLIHKLL
jgi:capsule biosynthesis phosphatase